MSEQVTNSRLQRTYPVAGKHTGSAAIAERDATAGSFDSLAFRRAMGQFATGVTVVSMLVADATATPLAEEAPERAFGITVNAFMSVSLEPPLIAISIDKSAHAHATLMAAERFGVSVLAEEQQTLSDHFAGRRVDVGLEPFEQFAGFPVVSGAIAQIVCSSYRSYDAGDHTIFLGEVQALRRADGRPLIFHAGRYDRLDHQSI